MEQEAKKKAAHRSGTQSPKTPQTPHTPQTPQSPLAAYEYPAICQPVVS